MKRHFLFLLGVLAVLAGSGCSLETNRDYYAKLMLASDCGPLIRALAGTGPKLKAQGRIDQYGVITTAKGLPLDYWLIYAKTGGGAAARTSLPTVVMLHGLTESKANYLAPGELIAKKGYNVVLIDLRAHGKSGGEYVGYGVTDAQDVKYVLDRLIRDGEVSESLYVFGVTWGGAAGIHYAAVEPRVRGVLAMAPYKDAATIGRRRLMLHAPTMSEALYEEVLARAGVMGEFDPVEASTVKAAAKLRCPLRLVHGLLDWGVPLDHSQAIYDAAGEPKEFTRVAPGPEQLALALVWNQWVADQMDKMIRAGGPKPPAPPKKPPVTKPPVKKPAPPKPPVKKPPPPKPPVKKPPPKPPIKPAPPKPPVKPAPLKKPPVVKPPAPKPAPPKKPPVIKPPPVPEPGPGPKKPAPTTKPAPKTGEPTKPAGPETQSE